MINKDFPSVEMNGRYIYPLSEDKTYIMTDTTIPAGTVMIGNGMGFASTLEQFKEEVAEMQEIIEYIEEYNG